MSFKYISLDLTGDTKFLSVRIQYIANGYSVPDSKHSCLIHVIYSLSILCTIFFLISSKLSSALFTWFSHLHLILYARFLKYLCSVEFLAVRIFLSVISLLTCGNLLYKSSPLQLCILGHFNKRWDLLFSFWHGRKTNHKIVLTF